MKDSRGGSNKLPSGKWSSKYDCCVSCQKSDYRHMGKGLCSHCIPIDVSRETKRKSHDKLYFGGNQEVALQRDGHRCTICQTSECRLIVHHIDGNGSNSQNPNNDLGNLQTLCQSCHAKLHRNVKQIGMWSVNYDCCKGCGTTTTKYGANGLCKVCYDRIRHSSPRKPAGKWSMKYDCCQHCGTTEVKHKGHGLCEFCYQRTRKVD